MGIDFLKEIDYNIPKRWYKNPQKCIKVLKSVKIGGE